MSLQVDKRNTPEDGSEFDSESNPTIETYSENDSVQQNDNIELELFSDAGVWNIPLPDAIRLELVLRGPNNLQNRDGPFKSMEKSAGANSKGEIRTLNKDWFTASLKTGRKYTDHGFCTPPLTDVSTVSVVDFFLELS